MAKTFKFAIKSWIGGNVLFEAELDAKFEAGPERVRLGEAVKAAYLQDADLQGADLRGADLQGADLRGADLRGAYLRGADLRGADLRGAYLQDAYLQDADLQDADLQGAYLRGEKIYIAPLNLSGLYWEVLIYADRMQIGCENHTVANWDGFDDRRILEMSGKEAATFWKANKKLLIPMAKAHAKAHAKAKKEFEAEEAKKVKEVA